MMWTINKIVRELQVIDCLFDNARLATQLIEGIKNVKSISAAKWIWDGGAGRSTAKKYNSLQDSSIIPMIVLLCVSDGVAHFTWRDPTKKASLCSSVAQQEFSAQRRLYWKTKKKNHKPVIVLTDLAYCYQCLQVLIGLVRVDVVQWAAVPGVSIGGCEVNGDLGEKLHESNRTHLVQLYSTFCKDYYVAACYWASLTYA